MPSGFRFSDRPEPRIVAEVEVDVAEEMVGVVHRRPPSTGDSVAFVVAVPRKCDSFACSTRIWFPVELTVNSDEGELAVSVGTHLQEGGPHEFNRVEVPEVHLDNSPGSEQMAFHTKNVLLTHVGFIDLTI